MNYSTPLIVGDTIYSTRNQGGYTGGGNATLISAFDLATGAINWTYSGDFAFPSQAAVGGGFVVFHSGIIASDPNSEGEQLYVLDAITGALRYKVPVPGTLTAPTTPSVMPLLVPNPADGTVTAYCAEAYRVYAVHLGATTGSVLWTQNWIGATASIPTLVGSSIVLAGPGNYTAFDLNTGALNNFHFGTVHGGGGSTVAYDAARQHVYILAYDSPDPALSAFRYVSNAQIEFLWRRVGAGVGLGSVAIGSSGKVYATDQTLLIEVDPDTGMVLRSVFGTFDQFQTPAITAGIIWTNSGHGYQTMAYNLETLQLVRTFFGANFGDTYTSSGAFADGYFVLDYGTIVGRPGFDVYAGGAPAAQPLNISTRVRVEVGDNVMIGGFIITGTEPKRVIIRALGPSLGQNGIGDVLADPVIELRGSDRQLIRSNDNWRETQEAAIQATMIAPANDLESAMVVTLSPGAYTVVVSGKNGGTGVGLVEVYDLESATQAKLANISTRGFVGTGDEVMIGGFILGNGVALDKVMIRGIGPSLTQSGIGGALPDSTLELRDANGALVRSNDNWRDTQQAAIQASGLAPQSDLEAAMIVSLAPAAYTAILAGKNGATGVGLVEVYQLPNQAPFARVSANLRNPPEP